MWITLTLAGWAALLTQNRLRTTDVKFEHKPSSITPMQKAVQSWWTVKRSGEPPQWSPSLGYSLFGASHAIAAGSPVPKPSGSTTTLPRIKALTENERITSHGELDKGFSRLICVSSSFPQLSSASVDVEVRLRSGARRRKNMASHGTIGSSHRAEKTPFSERVDEVLITGWAVLSFSFCGRSIDVRSKRAQFSLAVSFSIRAS